MRVSETMLRVRIAERAMEIGDSYIGGCFLDGWKPSRSIRNQELLGRIATVIEKLRELREQESIHGEFTFLDRFAPEIIEYEEDVERSGGRSIYRKVLVAVPSDEGVTGGKRAA